MWSCLPNLMPSLGGQIRLGKNVEAITLTFVLGDRRNPQGWGALPVFLCSSLGQDHCGYCHFASCLEKPKHIPSSGHDVISETAPIMKRHQTACKTPTIPPSKPDDSTSGCPSLLAL